jgi:2-polyprenyl-3-methyl-5-hydroxy-6-metoxy-1,4-benzoquinol methylase
MTTTTPAASAAFDEAKAEAFIGKVLGDTGAANAVLLATIGDRLGLFRTLSEHGTATSAQVATRAEIDERYTREWLNGMASAGYLEYEPATGSFTLPAEHAPALAQEHGPFFFGGVHEMMSSWTGVIDRVLDAFRNGGGVPQSAYDEHMWGGLERFTAGWFENLLLPVWVPAMPRVQTALETGADVADIGCGRGRALIKLAQAFPKSRYVGYDVFEPAVQQAKARAEEAGVGDRVRFECRDASAGLPEQFDVVTTFDVVHDAVDPAGLLTAIRTGLRPDGTYVCVDINCSDRVEENAGPIGTLFYTASLLYCMTTSLAHHGEGLGTCGLPESKLRTLCAEAGFGEVRRVPLENPFNNLYEITL